MAQDSRSSRVDAIVIGAGFSGLYMLHRLQQEGYSTRLFEAGDGVGGTWYWNRYPGARCDSESHFYCYSFSDEIREEWKWSCRYPAQPEILEYLNFVADRLDLKKHIDFGTRVTSGKYDEREHGWVVETDSGETVRAQFLITGVGNTSTPARPKLNGLDLFEGEVYHTALWPHEGVDFTGKKVALVGTGSSGIQSTPMIAKQAKELTVFQRTANYIIPAHNHDLTDDMRREHSENHDELRRLAKASPIGMPFPLPEKSALEVEPEERIAMLDRLYKTGGFRFHFASFTDIVTNADANAVVAGYVEGKIRERVTDPAKADVLCEFNHPIGTKRPPIDTDYLEAFNQDNVSIVSIRKNPIREATANGLTMENGDHHEFDAIVFATGFDTVTGTLLKLNLTGRNGQTLDDKWAEGPQTYLGLASAGFPNLFMITGPQSPAILVNFPMCIEKHVDWITDAMNHMRDIGAVEFEADPHAEAEWVQKITSDVDGTLMTTVDSWYMNSNIEGKPKVFTAYFAGWPSYAEIIDDVAKQDYKGFEFRQKQVQAA